MALGVGVVAVAASSPAWGTVALGIGLGVVATGLGEAVIGGVWGRDPQKHIGHGLFTATTGMLSGFPVYGATSKVVQGLGLAGDAGWQVLGATVDFATVECE